MNLSPVVLAIPVFLLLILLEVLYEYFSERRTYRLNDAVTNISAGVLSQVSGVFLKVLSVGVYVVVYEKLAFFHIEPTMWSLMALIFLQDLCYYWSHRMSHEVSLFWGGHVVHHQSEDYNLSVALRQSSTSVLWSFMFYLPLALFGFDPLQFLMVSGINLLYQFWIHTEHIGKMGILEWVMNTPSHHRVHHGRDPKYIDRNYAGIFIIWDRLFGTFQEEEEKPVYGITKPLQSWDPVYANFAHYIDLGKAVRKTRSVPDAIKVLFNKPGWMPDYLGGYLQPHAVSPGYQKYNQHPPGFMNAYILVQYVLLILVTALYLFFLAHFPPVWQVAIALWIGFGAFVIGWLLQRRRSGFLLEALRLLALLVGLVVFESLLVIPLTQVVLGLFFLELLSLGWLYLLFKKEKFPDT